jgi:hypothetical protein
MCEGKAFHTVILIGKGASRATEASRNSVGGMNVLSVGVRAVTPNGGKD